MSAVSGKRTIVPAQDRWSYAVAPDYKKLPRTGYAVLFINNDGSLKSFSIFLINVLPINTLHDSVSVITRRYNNVVVTLNLFTLVICKYVLFDWRQEI